MTTNRRLQAKSAGGKIDYAKLKAIFDNVRDQIIVLDLQGRIIDANASTELNPEITFDQHIGKHFPDIALNYITQKSLEKSLKVFRDTVAGKPTRTAVIEGFDRNKKRIYIEFTYKFIEHEKMRGIVSILRNITKRKQAEEELRKHRDKLNKMVQERTKEFEDANTALKVLLKQRDDDRSELETSISNNITKLVLPYIDELKKPVPESRKTELLIAIEGSLNTIASAFTKKLSSPLYGLTPAEIRIAELIKQGKSTKEIIQHYNLSQRTIENHRYHIRKKLGISKRKINLMSYLRSID